MRYNTIQLLFGVAIVTMVGRTNRRSYVVDELASSNISNERLCPFASHSKLHADVKNAEENSPNFRHIFFWRKMS